MQKQTLRKILRFHLISWYENFVERHSFCVESPETIRKLCLFKKFPHQESRWNYGILHTESQKSRVKILISLLQNWKVWNYRWNIKFEETMAKYNKSMAKFNEILWAVALSFLKAFQFRKTHREENSRKLFVFSLCGRFWSFLTDLNDYQFLFFIFMFCFRDWGSKGMNYLMKRLNAYL